jgi:hypothetical protein
MLTALCANFGSSSFDTIPTCRYPYVEIYFNLTWLIALAQGFSKLVIEVNIKAHGVKECVPV